jgi:hypothetical protein
VRVGRDEYDVLALDDLREFAQGHPVDEILRRLRRYYLDTHHTILAFN